MKTKTLLSIMTVLLFFYCSLFISCKSNTSRTATTQTDIYDLMKKAIHDNDTKRFDSLVKHIPVIDSLLPVEEDWRNQHAFTITIRPDTCIFQGAGYQLYF